MVRRILGLGLVIAAMALVFAVPASAAPHLVASTDGAGTVVRTHGQRVVVDPGQRSGIAYSQDWFDSHPRAAQRTPRDQFSKLPYQGGNIVSGAPRVYLVFWGSQWGTQSVGVDGYNHYSGDTAGIAPVEQAFFTGLGTNNELWDGVMTQYCQGVAIGATTCGASTTHVGYPTGGALAGVWEDNASASPGTSTFNQLAAEAVVAAQHFGNTTSASNKNAQYVIISPHGTNPDSYKTAGFCAWHSSTTSAYGELAFTNMPYLTDAGASCYANSVSPGTALDGISVVGGHEYAETITDPFAASAWWDPNDNTGGENGDKCSIGLGFAGGLLTLSTGTFAVQATYGNDAKAGAGGCALTHAIVGGGSGGTAALTVSKTGTGSGTVMSQPSGISCGATCSASFTTGTLVTLSETPGSGSTFSGWSGGGCTGTLSTCRVTINSATSVSATFSTSGGGTSALTVSKLGTGTGTVTSSPSGIDCGATCSVSFTTGSNVVLSESPGSGSTFGGWSGGGCSGSATTCNVSLTAAANVTATFTASGGGGTTTTSGALSGWYDFSLSYYFYHQGKNPTYTATVSPNVAGQQVLFTLQKKNSSGVWNTISTASFALNSSSAVAVKITGLGQGRYRVDASYAGDGSHFGSTSAWSNIKVTA